MLKIRSIDDDGPERRIYSIVSEGDAAGAEALAAVARIAGRLVAENELPGTYIPGAPGVLALDLPAAQRSFFHDGIVFAALDAVNDPVKSPTLTRLDFDPGNTPAGGSAG